ncbi:SIR2 family protein [Clostridium estertheticum]|uniref:SIR2 family NAD-dependent protein deacylase n=1 Tax=Clostridium estertheticum TaxID=238834 RepID=UPI001C0D6F7D|nr:SIR2 family protein [Clostridium estertheticum]MBU3200302.1 SIR2 family protein [Clostridium estertheticum]WAG64474.1 SIR2 family protein [Clostridium estertheticum]
MEGAISRLIKKIRNGEVTLWSGAGMSLYAGVPSGNKLAEAIIKSAEPSEREILEYRRSSLQDVAEEFVQMRNGSKTELISIVKELIDIDYKDKHVHEALAGIPQIKTIITTNYDYLFEEAYGRNKIDVIVNSKSIPVAQKNNKVKLYKIHGDFSNLESIILTRSDYTNFFSTNEYNAIWDIVRSAMIQYNILFIGYSLEDQNVEYMLNQISKKLGSFRNECFFVAPKLHEYKQKYLANKHIQYIDSTAEELINIIAAEVNRNILNDCVNRKVDIITAHAALKNRGIEAEFNVNDLVSVTSVNAVDGTPMKGKINFCSNIDKTIITAFNEVITGKRFGLVTFPAGSLASVTSELKGIELPIFNGVMESELVIQTQPHEEFVSNLVLKKSGEVLENVQVKIYRSQYKVQLKLEYKMFNLTMKFLPGEETLKFEFSFEKPNNVVEDRKFFIFLEKWFTGDIAMLYNASKNSIVFTIPDFSKAIKKEALKQIIFNRKLLDKLFIIQNNFEVCFTIPEAITKEDKETIMKVLDSIETEGITCGELRIDIEPQELEHYREETEKIKDGVLTFIANELVEVVLWGVKLILGRHRIDIKNPVIKNQEEIDNQVRERNEWISIVIDSINGKNTYYYYNEEESIGLVDD